MNIKREEITRSVYQENDTRSTRVTIVTPQTETVIIQDHDNSNAIVWSNGKMQMVDFGGYASLMKSISNLEKE